MSRRLVVDLSDEQAAEYGDWTECAAFRIRDRGDGTAELWLTDDLELITRPESTA